MFSVSHPAYLSRFQCLGSECEDTCCYGWSMTVDAPTFARTEAQAPELLVSITPPNAQGMRAMRRDAHSGRCVQWQDGLCGIERRYGTALMNDACHFYPRLFHRFGDTLLMSAVLSCPEITRLALYDAGAFTWRTSALPRLPHGIQDYTPPDLNAADAVTLHQQILAYALTPDQAPAETLTQLYRLSLALDRMPPARWPEALPLLQHEGPSSPPEKAPPSDAICLLHALGGLMAAAKKAGDARLGMLVRSMEAALRVTLRWDTLAILPLPDSPHAVRALQTRWDEEWRPLFLPALQRYLATELTMSCFPFGGVGDTICDRILLLSVRFATVQLGLMSLCALSPHHVPDATWRRKETVRVVQSLSRFLDHLGDPRYSLQLYASAGWQDEKRLQALVHG